MNAERSIKLRFDRPGISAGLLVLLWVLPLVSFLGRIFITWQWWDFLVALSSMAFIVELILTLSRAKPAAADLPDVKRFLAKRTGFWTRTVLIALGMTLTLLVGLMIGSVSVLLVCGLLGLGVTLAWRQTLTWKMVGMGLAAGLISALGTAFLGNGDLAWAAANLVTIPPAFTGGALLLQGSQLGHVRILDGEPGLGLKGFLIGCALALPASFLNLVGNMQSQDTWISQGWQTLYAFVPAIAEETWARLLLVSFCYAVLRPVANQYPRLAIFIAILVSTITHAFFHSGISPTGLIFGALLYEVPLALLLIKKDFEHAVGYHFMIDLIRYIAAFLPAQA